MAISEQKTIGDTEWVSVNALTGIPVGTEMEITVTTVNGVQIWEGNKPADDFRGGKPITSMRLSYATVYISAGSGEIWAICPVKGIARLTITS